MASQHRTISQTSAVALLFLLSGAVACSGAAGSEENSGAEKSADNMESEPQEETQRRAAEADAMVDDQLVDDIVSRYPHPVQATPDLSEDHELVSTDQSEWHEDLVEYWEEFPYDEIASAYDCEIRDINISEPDDGTPSRNFVLDCDSLDDNAALDATLTRIETEAAERTQAEAAEMADSESD